MVGLQGQAPGGEGRLSDTLHIPCGSYPSSGDEMLTSPPGAAGWYLCGGYI